MEIHGHCDPRFEGVREAFATNFERRDDVGASAAVTLEGELVVDLWAGETATDARPEGGAPWERDTIINTWSTTKTMAALCCLVLADQGELDLDAPIERVWPGFRAEGKAGVLPRHVMSHSAGLSGWAEPLDVNDLYDHERCATLLARQEPWWEPGSASGYHAITQGYLLGELVRRVTGQSLGEFFAAEIAGPLGADYHIGTDAEHDDRVAHVIAPETGLETKSREPDSIGVRTVGNPRFRADVGSTIDWRRAEIPAAGGHGNARAVARIHSALACGGEVDGVRLMSPAGVERVLDEQTYGPDHVLPGVIRFGVGFGLRCPEIPVSPNERAFYWGGWGGSLVVIDLDARLTVAYVMNKMKQGTQGDSRSAAVLLSTYQALAENVA